MANDFSSDPNCVALWKLDSNASDAKGGNHLTPVNAPTYDSGDKKEGSHCADLEHGSVQYFTIADADLDAGFPGKNGTSEQSFSICFWAKLESLGIYQGFIDKLAASANVFSVYLRSANQLRFIIGYNNGVNQSLLEFGTNPSTGIWYHIAVVYDHTDNSMKIRVWDDNAGALLDDNAEGTADGDMSPDTADLEVGRYNKSDSYTFDGKIDEVVIFNKALTDNEIDLVRAGTYGAGITEKQSSDTGSSVEGTPSQSAILASSESGSGVDVVESLESSQAKTSADIGAGAEGTPLSGAILAGSESGSGLEALIARLLSGDETGGAVEASSLEIEGQFENLFADEPAEGADRLAAKIEMPTKGGGMKLWI